MLVMMLFLLGCHPLGSMPELDTAVEQPVAQVELWPTALDLGAVEAGDVADASFFLTNHGAAAATIGSVGEPLGDAGFSVHLEAGSLAPGEQVEGRVSFTPLADGDALAQVGVLVADAVLTLFGVGQAPVLQVGVIEIGEAVIGCEVEAALAVSNVGSLPLTLQAVESSLADVTVLDWPATLAPGESGTVTLQFAPTVGAAQSGVLTLQGAGLPATALGFSVLGYAGQGTEQSFTFQPTDPTDILFVVDGGTVSPYAADLAVAASAYIGAMSSASADFQVASVGGASVCPPEPTYATRSDTSLRASSVLTRAFAAGAGPQDDDLLSLAVSALAQSQASGCLEGFRREGADLEIVVVSTGPGTNTAAALAALQAGAPAGVRVSALVPTTGSCGTRADDYLDAASITGGVRQDVCNDWTSAFGALAQLPTGTGPVREPLATTPIVSTLDVRGDGLTSNAWQYDVDSNTVVVDADAFVAGTEVVVRYVPDSACE